jgi:hypothetical protein
MPPKTKSSTLVIATKSPENCAKCRHSNQGTVDFREGHLLCWMDKQTKRPETRCDVVRHLPRSTSMDDPKSWSSYFLYQPFDGSNCTYDKSTDLRIIAEDADEALKRSLRADKPLIPARE